MLSPSMRMRTGGLLQARSAPRMRAHARSERPIARLKPARASGDALALRPRDALVADERCRVQPLASTAGPVMSIAPSAAADMSAHPTSPREPIIRLEHVHLKLASA